MTCVSDEQVESSLFCIDDTHADLTRRILDDVEKNQLIKTNIFVTTNIYLSFHQKYNNFSPE